MSWFSARSWFSAGSGHARYAWGQQYSGRLQGLRGAMVIARESRGRRCQAGQGPLAGVLLLMLALPLLAACGASGFRPLHGPTASGENLSEVLASVKIDPIPGRVGQKLRNQLIFETTGGNFANAPKYSLNIAIRENVTSTLVQRSGESLSQVYNLDASFELMDLKSKKTIVKGTSYGRAGFERFVSAYANVRARINAEDRAATTVASEIKNRVAAFLSTRG